MKRFAALILSALSLFTAASAAQNLGAYNGQCSAGGQAVVTQGLPSSGTQPLAGGTPNVGSGVLGSFPLCQVTVYLTGTNTPVASNQIFANNSNTPTVLGNPFTANVDGSFLFYAAIQVGYDITISGGGLPASFTTTGVFLCNSNCGSSSNLLPSDNVFTGSNQFTIGAILGPTSFAGLSAGRFATAGNGTVTTVTDGSPGSPCTGSGPGSLAVRLAGSWVCLPLPAPPPPLGAFSVCGITCFSSPTAGTLPFGTVSIGTSSAPGTVTLTNGTTGTITGITFPPISGTNSADFTIGTNTCSASLGPSGVCTLSLSFRPTLNGNESALLTVNDSDPSSPQTISLTGSGFGSSLLTINPTSFSFGTLPVGNTATATIALCAGGALSGSVCNQPDSIAINISGVSFSETVDFNNTNNCPPVLQAGSSCLITVVFAPQSAASFTDTITVTSSAQGSPQTITLTGTGTTPVSPPTLSSIALAPSTATITANPPGNTVQLTATGTYSDASTKNLTLSSQYSASGAVSGVTEALVDTPNSNNSDCGYFTTSSTRVCPAMQVTQGQLGVCAFYLEINDNTVPSFTDSMGDPWSLVTSQKGAVNGQNETLGIWKTVFGATGNVTITGRTNQGNIASLGEGCAAFSGNTATGAVDVSASAKSGAGTGTMSSGNFTTTGTDIVFCAFADRAQQNGMSPSGTFSTQLGQSSPAWSSMQTYAVNKTSGTYACTGTETGGNTNTWIAAGVAFLGTSSSGPQVANVGTPDCQNPPSGPTPPSCAFGNAPGLVTGLVAGPPTGTISGNSGFVVKNQTGTTTLGTGVTTVSYTLPLPIGVNQTVFVQVGTQDTTSSIGTPTDSCGHTYSSVVSRLAGTGVAQQMFASQNVSACGTDTVTVTFGAGGATNPTIYVGVLDGLLAAGGVDGTPGSVATSTSSSTASVATSATYDVFMCGTTSNGTAGAPLFGTSEGRQLTSSGGSTTWTFATFGTGTFSCTANFSAAANAVTQAVAFKANGSTATITVNSSSSSTYSALSQQPVSLVFLPNTPWTTALPTTGPFGVTATTNLLTNSDAIIRNIYGSVDTPSGTEVTAISTTPGGDSADNKGAFYYCDQSCPVFKVVSAAHVPGIAANNPVGVYFHFPAGAQFSSNVSDQGIAIWDQSLDIDPTQGGRLYSEYEFCSSGSCPRALGNCTCTTTSCANTTSACQISANYADYNHPFNDPRQGFGDGIAANNIGAGSGTMNMRMAEVQANSIPHALRVGSACVQTGLSFPAISDANPCTNQTNAVRNGALFWIDSAYNCAALQLWQQPFCVALQTYGGYMGPTNGVAYANSPGLFLNGMESPIAEHLAGATDPYTFLNFLNTYSTTPSGPVYCTGSPVTRCNFYPYIGMPGLITGDAGNGFKPHLHVVDPCVVRHMWGQPATCNGLPTD